MSVRGLQWKAAGEFHHHNTMFVLSVATLWECDVILSKPRGRRSFHPGVIFNSVLLMWKSFIVEMTGSTETIITSIAVYYCGALSFPWLHRSDELKT